MIAARRPACGAGPPPPWARLGREATGQPLAREQEGWRLALRAGGSPRLLGGRVRPQPGKRSRAPAPRFPLPQSVLRRQAMSRFARRAARLKPGRGLAPGTARTPAGKDDRASAGAPRVALRVAARESPRRSLPAGAGGRVGGPWRTGPP